MPTRLRTSARGRSRIRDNKVPDTSLSGVSRALLLVGVVALVSLASSCLPVGTATSSTYTTATAEVLIAHDPAADSAAIMLAATTTRPGSPTSDAVLSDSPLEAPERQCPPQVSEGLEVPSGDFAVASIEISRATYGCAHEVGLADAANPAAVATLMAHGVRGPLLLAEDHLDPELVAELERLAPDRIIAVGINIQALRSALGDFNVEQVAVDHQATIPLPEIAPTRVRLVTDDERAAPLAALSHQVGIGVVAVAGDLRALAPAAREMIFQASEVELDQNLNEDAAWQLEAIRSGHQIPGGGLLMFEPELDRRLVAIYGHPASESLGVLGEQDADGGVERLRSIAEGYDADGAEVLPTFEIITTVASGSPGRDGDYSAMTARDVIRPWIETAAANDMYVVLDFQPGRTDFLTQVRVYEEFLLLPHVGLALDPEWRLKPDQVHLEQIGTVDAAEINQVVTWLADLVRANALPQKLLIIHQFADSMITNRSAIDTPSELAVMIHMDGQGTMKGKYNTWNNLTGQRDADQFYWGWKNFYDEDTPNATPQQVLELTPTPLFVSFQ